MSATDAEKAACVDRWLEDVSGASRRWKTAKAAQQSSERVVAYLNEIRGRMYGHSDELDARMDEAIARNKANAEAMGAAALRLSDIEGRFYDVLQSVEPPELAEAWRMRCIEHKTWSQCSMDLHYNRQHLERLNKRAKPLVYDIIPREYRL